MEDSWIHNIAKCITTMRNATVSVKIWTQIIMSISDDTNRYSTSISISRSIHDPTSLTILIFDPEMFPPNLQIIQAYLQ